MKSHPNTYCLSQMDRVERLIGCRYRLWTADMPDSGPMSYAENGEPPSKEEIRRIGINCVGVVNLIRRYKHLPVPGVSEKKPFAGGVKVWFKTLGDEGVLEPFDMHSSYPVGTMLLRDFKDEEDQGHVAVVASQNSRGVLFSELLHSYFTYPVKEKDGLREPGLKKDRCVAFSHFWLEEGFYTHICRPENWL